MSTVGLQPISPAKQAYVKAVNEQVEDKRR
jgi:hypothetical protein